MTVLDDMREVRAALRRGEAVTDAQLAAACEAILARPTGSTRFAADLVWTLGRRLAQAEDGAVSTRSACVYPPS